MFQIVSFIKALVPHIPSQQQRDQEYLNQATDIYDVERRIAEIDHRTARPLSQMHALGGAVH